MDQSDRDFPPTEVSTPICGGLFRRRACWLPTGRGWIVLGLLAVGASYLTVRLIYPFLAMTQPVRGEILVVEAWLPDECMPAVRDEFDHGGYQLLLAIGGPIAQGDQLAAYKTGPDLTKAVLERMGMDPRVIVAVPSYGETRDRTYEAAVTLRHWLADHRMPVSRLNLVSRSAHARRSRLLVQLAFGPKVAVGIIALPAPEYDSRHWWRTSAGFRDVVDETVAYLYARVLFHPGPAP
jgi:hypothetical protein